MKKFIPIVLTGLLTWASAHAAVVDTGFEDLTPGTTVNGYEGLVTFNSADQGIAYHTATSAAAPGGSPASIGSNALRYQDTGTGVFDLRVQGFAGQFNNYLPSSVSFDYYTSVNPNLGAAVRPNLFVRGEGNTQGVTLQLMNGVRQVGDSANGVLNTAQLSLDTWYNFYMLINPVQTATDTYDLTVTAVGGSEVFSVTGVPFANDIGNVTLIEWATNQGTGAQGADFYLDNIQILGYAIPEPSTLALLLPGLLMLRHAFRRRR